METSGFQSFCGKIKDIRGIREKVTGTEVSESFQWLNKDGAAVLELNFGTIKWVFSNV